MSQELTKESLERTFKLLSGRLDLMQSNPVRLVVCGGSALIATGLRQRTTNDADVVALLSANGELLNPDPLPAFLLEASAQVARDLGLKENWLNNEPSRNEGGLFQMGLPEGFAERLTKQVFGSRLTIYFIGRVDQIHFKLYAAADQRDDTHIADLRALKPTDAELEAAARWTMTHDASEGSGRCSSNYSTRWDMKPSLLKFKEEYRELLLNFLWRQWSALGVAGQTGGEDAWVIDPEALLIFTTTMGRHDPRLFDEVLDWLKENGRFINVTRLKRILKLETFAGERALAAVAACLGKGSASTKWKLLAESETQPKKTGEFFLAADGKPVPVLGESEPHFLRYGFKRGPLRLRGYSQNFRPAQPTNLALQLRALFGINVRCEIVLYLLTHEAAHPSQIAREAYYFERAVQGTLVDMSQSGVVGLRLQGREKHYWLKPENWAALLNRPPAFPQWVTWPPLFSALERIWLKVNDPQLEKLDSLLQSSELRQLMVEVRPAIERARYDKNLSDDREYLGEKYLPVFLADVIKLLT